MTDNGPADTSSPDSSVIDPSSKRLVLRRKIRHAVDKSASVGIAVGGVSVIVAILLIFFYLFYEVVPLFESASVEETASYQLADSNSGLLHLAIEEQSQVAMRLGDAGDVLFFEVATGTELARKTLPIPEGEVVTGFALDTESSGVFALGTDVGNVLVASYGYETSYGPDNARILTPVIEYPFGEETFALSPAGIVNLAVRFRGDNLVLAALDTNNEMSMYRVSKQTSLLSAFGGGNSGFTQERLPISITARNLSVLYIDESQRWVYLIDNAGLTNLVDLQSSDVNENVFTINNVVLLDQGLNLTQTAFLLGGLSLMVADDGGNVSQWFLVRENNSTRLEKVRTFSADDGPIVAITTEQRRKNFFTVSKQGYVGIYNTTAQRQVYYDELASGSDVALAVSPRGNTMMTVDNDGAVNVWSVHNEHPEVSFSALWQKVWYESYAEPEYTWQSSSASNDFEPKYSMMPLAFGTLKAAFYAMLLATPLAICGAIFTGYFMAPAMRRKVKPLIELMEALPTVVLGFLAGLWLAPFVEKNLLGIFAIVVILPCSILLASYLWVRLPSALRHRVPDGWEAAILVPVILVFGYLSFAIATPLETWFFGGDLRFWITTELGVNYDQRNAMVVGFAMGFAVIPTIFSIAEDAIFTVPKHLTYGSLALGATPWQSLQRVVLPTASPGIFSGVMIGFGRAVGETMIVLMATGNTPIMDINIFEGMRTLAANIAVEIPESEVDSTHYRILFFAALVLFMFTFVFNSVAEVVRQRLRNKYSTI